ncbi:hypothetical protein ELI24_09915 [Rhizobium ruizarguesonis]|jgi:hypothetical protein|uniref:hypothetical protein n=1 Tax=Rhizobium ruizarguesonis TaxID=2081791 RepID=UPI0010304A16|nr:hypothetical protein [Rhizobium ruizarguesonis]NEJ95357.1 hypothetical protein [Rhizobium ruizarguesonis]TAV98667.1 hypothetical protein ELI24_09915 [Rhizobium ruizarguesonis]
MERFIPITLGIALLLNSALLFLPSPAMAAGEGILERPDSASCDQNKRQECHSEAKKEVAECHGNGIVGGTLLVSCKEHALLDYEQCLTEANCFLGQIYNDPDLQ